jgi:hypothetical protein
MIKNKIDATKGHCGLITIRYGVGIDELRTMLNVAQAYKIVKVSKNKRKQEIFQYESGNKKIEVIGIERFRLELTKQNLVNELMNQCTESIIGGYKILDDETLAALSEDAVTTGINDDDNDEVNEYLNTTTPEIVNVTGVEITEDGEVIEHSEAIETPEIE